MVMHLDMSFESAVGNAGQKRARLDGHITSSDTKAKRPRKAALAVIDLTSSPESTPRKPKSTSTAAVLPPPKNGDPLQPRKGAEAIQAFTFQPDADIKAAAPSQPTASQSSRKAKSASKKKAKQRVIEPISEPKLCAEQEALVQLILRGENVFYTGSAGCGKSTVLRAFVARLKRMGKLVKIVAPTGRAAVDIGGQTIFAYAGITPDSLKIPLEELRKRGFGKVVYDRFNSETDILVIDEISMVENHLLERLSAIMSTARSDTRPFGGVQVVFLGDFYQRKHLSLLLYPY